MTAAPSYTNATSNPLSMDLSGNLRTVPNGNVASGATDAGNPVKIGGAATALIPSPVANGSRVDAWYNPIGAVVVAAATRVNLDGSGNTGSGFMANNSTAGAGQAIATYSYVYNGTTWDRQRGDTNGTAVIPPVQNGSLNHSAILAATTNSTNVKNAAGIITEISVYNSSATIAWLKLYDVAAAPTCGTGTPVGRYMIPGASAGGAGSNVTISLGKNFATGISYCVTTGIADADTGAVAAATYTVNFSYR